MALTVRHYCVLLGFMLQYPEMSVTKDISKSWLKGLGISAGALTALLVLAVLVFVGAKLYDQIQGATGVSHASMNTDFRSGDLTVSINNLNKELDKPTPAHGVTCPPNATLHQLFDTPIGNCFYAAYAGDNGNTIITGSLTVKNSSLTRTIHLAPSVITFTETGYSSSPSYTPGITVDLKPGQSITTHFKFDDSYNRQNVKLNFDSQGHDVTVN